MAREAQHSPILSSLQHTHKEVLPDAQSGVHVFRLKRAYKLAGKRSVHVCR